MIKKRKLANNKYSVTFSMPALDSIAGLYLVGEFNNWNESAMPMEQEADGSWSIKLTLEAEREYQYRYLDDQGVWHNDWSADAYARNSLGSENSVVSLVNGTTPAKRAAARRKKLL